jgi:hypothetical protein
VPKSETNANWLQLGPHKFEKVDRLWRWAIQASYVNLGLTPFRSRVNLFQFSTFYAGCIVVYFVLQKQQMVGFIVPIKMVGDVQKDGASCAVYGDDINDFGGINGHICSAEELPHFTTQLKRN